MPRDGSYFNACLAVYVMLRDEHGKAFMLRRKNTHYADGFYTVPAGKVEAGEGFLAAAVREVKEEAGVDVLPDDLALAVVQNRNEADTAHPDWVDLFFVASRWTGEPYAAEADKSDNAGWFDISDDTINIVPAVHYALKQIKDQGVSYSIYNQLSDAPKRRAS